MIALFRMFYAVYVIVLVLLMLSALSRLIFRKHESFADAVVNFLDDGVFAVSFPIMVFSKEGFKRLTRQIKEYI